MLTQQSITKYRDLYHRKFGIELTEEQATEQANRLINLVRVVNKPMPKAWESRYNQLLKERKGGVDEPAG